MKKQTNKFIYVCEKHLCFIWKFFDIILHNNLINNFFVIRTIVVNCNRNVFCENVRNARGQTAEGKETIKD